MEKHCDIIEKIYGALVKVAKRLSVSAYADEGFTTEGATGDSGEPPKPPTVNFEELISKARKEEKEKQYKTIEKLKSQVETLTKQHNEDLLKITALQQELEETKTKLSTAEASDSEALKTLKQEVVDLQKDKTTLENKIAELEKNKPVSREEVEAEVRKELETEYEVKTYKAEKMAELKNDLLVPELVIGTTKEEIDASIQTALERSKQIKEQLGIDGKKKRTPKSPSNPDVSGVQDNTYSLEYLASLDPASKEYAEVRKSLGLR